MNISKYNVTRLFFIIIYNAHILPLFDYGDIMWGDKNNSSLMDQLQVLQNKAAKTILDAPYTYPHPLKPSTNYTGIHLPTDANYTEY